MKHLLIVAFLSVIIPGPCFGEDGDWKFSKPPSVMGVQVGSTLKDVLAKLGRPLKSSDPHKELLPPHQELTYEGLRIVVLKADGKWPTRVWEIEVSSPIWTAYPEIKIGMPREAIIKLLGQPASDRMEDGTFRDWWVHPVKGDGLVLTFVDGKVSSIWIGASDF